MGVLAVDDGLAVGGFALLEEERVVALADGAGLEGEHGAEGEFAAVAVGSEVALGHGHDPVGGEEGVSSSVTTRAVGLLLGVGGEGVGVEHEAPGAALGHEHGDGGAGGLDAGAGGAVLLLGLDEGAGGHDGLRVRGGKAGGGDGEG